MNTLDEKLDKKRKTALYFFDQPNKKYYDYNIKIKEYYKNTKWLLFRIFGSKDGFMHIGLNKYGNYKKNHGYELFQPSLINKFIHKNNFKNILELGCGQGSNLAYLSYKNPDIKLKGIDLFPSTNMIKKQKNVQVITGDYHDLSVIPNNSVELIYAIETLCYAEDIKKVLQEAYRILCKDGILIVFDAYRKKEVSSYSFSELLFLHTIEDGFGLKQFCNISYFNRAVHQAGFSCMKEMDLKHYAAGYLKDISIRIRKYLRLGIMLKTILHFLPSEVLGGMKAGFLIEDSIKYNITVYKLHILTK